MELQALGQREQHDAGSWLEQGQASGAGTDDPWEEEKSWRDPSAHNIRSMVVKWLVTQRKQADLAKVMPRYDIFLLTFYNNDYYRHKGRGNASICNRTGSSYC